MNQAEDLKAETTRAAIPLPTIASGEAPRKITTEEREFQAFRALRVARANQRHEGARKARAAKVSSNFIYSLPSLSQFVCIRKRKRRPQRRSNLHRSLLHFFFASCFCLMLIANPSQNIGRVTQTTSQPIPYAMNMCLFFG